MHWKFNPPPGWPEQPEGWQPPPGWTPDPSWPPAPAGWQFWVPANPAPEAAPAAGTQAGPGPGSEAGAGADAGAEATEVHQTPPASAAGTPPATDHHGGGYQAGEQPGGAPAPGSAAPASGGAPSSPYGGGAGSPYPTAPYPTAAPGTYPGAPAAPVASRPWHHRWWVFGAAAAALLLVGCLAGSGVALLTHSDDPATSADPGPGEPVPTNPGPDGPDDPAGSGGLSPGEERTGQGPAIVSLDLPPDAFHTITVTFSGEGTFAAYLVDDEGEHVGSALGISYQDYSGTHLVELGATVTPTAVDIEDADGEWTLLLQDLNEAPTWPAETSGEGEMVMRIDPTALDGETVVEGTHDGESNFIVRAHQAEGDFYDLLFNEIGEYSGEAQSPVSGDSVALEIDADGSWTLSPA